MLRPLPARWFEILAARDDSTLVLEALARTGSVELQPRAGAHEPLQAAPLAPLLAQFADLQARCGPWWPAPQHCPPSAFPEPSLATLQRCLATLQAWAQQAEPLIRSLQAARAEAAELRLWQDLLAQVEAAAVLDGRRLAQAGPLVGVRLLVLPPGTEPAAVLGDAGVVLASVHLLDGAVHLLVAAPPEVLQRLGQRVTALKGSSHAVPAVLQAAGDSAAAGPGAAHVEGPCAGTAAAANPADADHAEGPRASQAVLQRRLQQLALHEAQASQGLAELSALPELLRALGDAHRLHWLLQHVHALEEGALFCWITGWTSEPDGQRLAAALADSGARALLHFAPPPPGTAPPLLLSNPPWARPFEWFIRALGMPSADEADPSVVLAVAVPLMFGYMFGDVGQGLVIAALAWWLRRRFALARLLLVGGLSAALFGLLFGSVFGLHGVLPALWLHPLDAPLAVLTVPLAGGALLLALGLGLDGLALFWRGQGRRWLLADGWLLAVYGGLLLGLWHRGGLWLAATAALAWCAGHALLQRKASAALAAAGELLEKTVQLLINTLSFARVGAFALAHAGLSSALVALMQAADSPLAQGLVLVLGNVLVILLEALVVSIQTTRLVLFEFFTRFLQGQGRVFRPLPAPPFTVREN